MEPDNIIAVWQRKEKEWKIIGQPKGNKENANFLIKCTLGDWSGYKNLEYCLLTEMPERTIDNYFFIVER